MPDLHAWQWLLLAIGGWTLVCWFLVALWVAWLWISLWWQSRRPEGFSELPHHVRIVLIPYDQDA